MSKTFHYRTFVYLICIGSAAALGSVSSRADSISFGTQLGSNLYESDGVTKLDGTFTFQLGVFDGFTPTASNTSLWDANWKPYDRAIDGEGFNPASGFVNHTTTLKSDGTAVAPFDLDGYVFFNQQPYVWVFNDKVGYANSEWALYTDAAWSFPGSSAANNVTTHSFRVEDAGTVVFGGINDTSSDGGTATFVPATFTIQLHAVPEPTVGGLLVLTFGGALLRRNRRR